MCIALRMRVFARMFKKQNLMDVFTLCAKLGYDLSSMTCCSKSKECASEPSLKTSDLVLLQLLRSQLSSSRLLHMLVVHPLRLPSLLRASSLLESGAKVCRRWVCCELQCVLHSACSNGDLSTVQMKFSHLSHWKVDLFCKFILEMSSCKFLLM